MLKEFDAGKLVKTTAIGTATIGVVVLNVFVFRVVGDIVSSAVLFGLGYLTAKLK